jgi:DMSO/TMAO reductase YedYZ heme-binding membrane subunit
MRRRYVVACGLAVGAVPLVLAATDEHLRDTSPWLVTATFAGALLVAALAVQPLLLALRPRAARLRDHRVLGVLAVSLVLLHVSALIIAEPEDALFAMSWDGPTRARMALLAMVLLLLTALLGIARRRLRWDSITWRVLHASLAALGVTLGVGHAVVTEGALDEEGTVVLVALGTLGVTTILVHLGRTLRRGAAEPERSADGARRPGDDPPHDHRGSAPARVQNPAGPADGDARCRGTHVAGPLVDAHLGEGLSSTEGAQPPVER